MSVCAARLRFRFLLQCCLAFAAVAPAGSASAQSAGSVYSRVHNSVGIVIVSTFEGQLVASGSAVTVAPQTMVTNRHVLIPGHRYQVYVSGNTYEAYMTTCDSTQDLCLLDVRKLDAPPVEFADANKLAVGDPVYAIGAPNEIGNVVGVSAVTKQKVFSAPQLTLSNGLITALRPVEDGNIIQTNAAISPGSSGGGLFDAKGRLVGITTFTMRSSQNVNMALPVSWVARLGVNGADHVAAMAPPPAAMPMSNTNDTQASPPTVPDMQPPAAMPAEPHAQAAATAPAPIDHTYQYGLIALGLGAGLLAFARWRRRDADEAVAMPAPAPIDPLLQRFLAEAGQELEHDQPDLTLWNAVIAEHKGDAAAARRAYVKRRAARLLSAEKDRQWAEAARRSQTT